jgi:hypothetical protein
MKMMGESEIGDIVTTAGIRAARHLPGATDLLHELQLSRQREPVVGVVGSWPLSDMEKWLLETARSALA